MAEQAESQYGGFWIRVLAALVDSAILWIAMIAIVFICAFLGSAGAILGAILPFAVMLLYFPLMHASARQATYGKALLGLKVEHAGTGQRISILRALGRDVIGKLISTLVLMIGFLMAAFTGRKQALHDKVSSTVVVQEGQSHVIAALAVAIFSFVGPVVFVMFVGAGIFAGLVGGIGAAMLGGMMAEQQKQAQKTIPAPAPGPAPQSGTPKPAGTPTAASAADVDKLLVPLTGLDKPGTARAGPAVLELSTFFGSGDPKVWVRVHAPLAVSRATVIVTRVADSANQSRYDPNNRFETEFFQGVQLSEARSGTPRMEGLRSINLTPGTTEQQVQRIDGVLKFAVPVGVRTLSFKSADAGKSQQAGELKLTLTSIKGNQANFSFSGPRDAVVEYRGFDAGGKQLPSAGTTTSGSDTGTLILGYSAPVGRVEALVASEVVRREYPFTLTRSGAAAAAVAAAPVAAKPAPAPAKVAPPPVPAKLAAAAPAVEVAPKPRPAAPRKRVAAPKAPAGDSATAAPAPRVAPAPAPVRRIIAAPKYSDLMTAVLNRDAAGVAELLEFGKWADKPDRSGNTPLMVAVGLGDAAVAEALLKAGAQADKAMRIAQEKGEPAMIALLQRHGATLRRP